jgi:hypothetical protein
MPSTNPSGRARRWGCLIVAAGVVLLALAAAGYLYHASRMPLNAPLARMYRTESDLRLLANAVEEYREAFGVYPVAGSEGLEAAVRHLSRHVDYLGGELPTDAWGRPFHYVPHVQYGWPDLPVLRGPDGFLAPRAYQLYSAGADGAPDTLADNITSWDADRSWRSLYRALNQQYFRNRQNR